MVALDPDCFFIYIDFHFLTKACVALPTGTVYAIFSAIGAIGTALMDVFYFGESKSGGRVASVILIVIGVVGLKALS